jgi:hypothetical protein
MLMNSNITVSELAAMAADNEKHCQVWHPVQGVIFDGTFDELDRRHYLADKTVDNFSIEDDVFIMNI